MRNVLRRIDPADVLVEIFSIVLAILLALAVNGWQQARATRDDVARSLANIRREILANQERLGREAAHHERVGATFARLVQRPRVLGFAEMYGTLQRVDPHGLNPFNGETFAWDIARSSPSINAVPYDVRALLERAYAEAAFLSHYRDIVRDDLHIAGTDRAPNYYASAFNFSFDMGDVIASERRLAVLYRDVLAKLPADAAP